MDDIERVPYTGLCVDCGQELLVIEEFPTYKRVACFGCDFDASIDVDEKYYVDYID